MDEHLCEVCINPGEGCCYQRGKAAALRSVLDEMNSLEPSGEAYIEVVSIIGEKLARGESQ